MRRTLPICLALILTVACGNQEPAGLPDSPDTDPPAPSPSADVSPPSLVSVGFSPRSVNVSRDSELVSIVAHLQDEDSGVARVTIQFRSPRGASITAFTELTLFRGDANSGRYEGFVLIPRGAPDGKWKLLFVEATDNAGNSKLWDTKELEERNIDVTLEVNSG